MEKFIGDNDGKNRVSQELQRRTDAGRRAIAERNGRDLTNVTLEHE